MLWAEALTRAQAYRQSRDLQTAAVGAIEQIGADAAAVPALGVASAKEPRIAESAANALARLGPAAAAAKPELQQLLQRNDHGGKDIKTRLARSAAEKALVAIDSSPAEIVQGLLNVSDQAPQ